MKCSITEKDEKTNFNSRLHASRTLPGTPGDFVGRFWLAGRQLRGEAGRWLQFYRRRRFLGVIVYHVGWCVTFAK